MRNRTEQLLRMACIVMAALLLIQVLRGIFHVASFFGVTVPPVPELSANSSQRSNPAPTPRAHGSVAPSLPDGSRTNTANNPPTGASKKTGLTTLAGAIEPETNPGSSKLVLAVSSTTNRAMPTPVLTNHFMPNDAVSNSKSRTNAAPERFHAPPSRLAPPGEMGLGMMPGMNAGSTPSFSAEVQARMDAITESGFLAPVMHPLPMALLGIAGNCAFLRDPNGQTGLVKEGDSLGALKLLRIGINRVLVDYAGKTEELTIFNGYGSDSLLAQKENSSK